MKAVFEALGNTNKAKKEVTEIMGGKVLEFSADKYFEAGETRGEAKLARLMNLLITNGRTDDALKVTNDTQYREAMYAKYAIA